MDFGALYPLLRQAHIGLVAISVALFAARGAGVLAGATWPRCPWARHGSAAIDTALLAAGVGLWAGLGLHPVHQPWLGAKLALLPVYVVLGSLALKRARRTSTRLACFVAALATVAQMAGIAIAHDPRGWWWLVAG